MQSQTGTNRASAIGHTRFVNIEAAAQLTGYSESYIRHNWTDWREKYGLRVFKAEGKYRGHLLFNYADIVRMIESWQVV